MTGHVLPPSWASARSETTWPDARRKANLLRPFIGTLAIGQWKGTSSSSAPERWPSPSGFHCGLAWSVASHTSLSERRCESSAGSVFESIFSIRSSLLYR